MATPTTAQTRTPPSWCTPTPRCWAGPPAGRPRPSGCSGTFYDPVHLHWWDAAASIVYFSHFVTTPAIAVVLWLRDRPRWAGFMRRWIALSAAGLATSFLYPAAPPWWAAQHHLVPAVARISTRGWEVIGLHGAGNLLNAAQLDAANPIAAMPSLHTAFATMAVAVFLPRVSWKVKPLLLAYPASMALTLIYSGEHWFIDVLAGIAYVVLVLAVVAGGESLVRRAGQGKLTWPPFIFHR